MSSSNNEQNNNNNIKVSPIKQQHHHHHHHHNHQHNTQQQRPFRIITQYGDMLVIKQGPDGSNKPCIMTFHDIGLNSDFQFSSFCEIDEVKLLMKTFSFIHVNFIGQELHSETLADDYQFPTMDQMADAIVDICVQMRVRSFIGMGVGAGAYILSLCALNRPDLVDGLFLINPLANSCSWTEWIYSKMTALTSKALHHRSSAATHSTATSSTTTTTSTTHQQSTTTTAIEPEVQPDQQHHHHHHHHGSIVSGIKKMTPTARLRQLIVSNLHLQHHNNNNNNNSQQQNNNTTKHDSQLDKDENPTTASTHSPQPPQSAIDESSPTTTTGAATQRRTASGGSGGSGAGRAGDSPVNQPRLPVEYLMYHHFGPVSVGRCRRLSDASPSTTATFLDNNQQQTNNNKTETTDTTPESTDTPGPTQSGIERQREETAGSSAGDSLKSSLQQGDGGGGSSSSTGSLAPIKRTGSYSSGSTGALVAVPSRPIATIGTILAGITNEKQRHAQIYSIYKGYFKRINRHNLILFTQSFLKRQSLNLRKDCGAAAHAAAAAAALGASICTPFGPPPGTAIASGSVRSAGGGRRAASTAHDSTAVASSKEEPGSAATGKQLSHSPSSSSGSGVANDNIKSASGRLRNSCHRLSSASRASSFASTGSGTSSLARTTAVANIAPGGSGGNLSGSNSGLTGLPGSAQQQQRLKHHSIGSGSSELSMRSGGSANSNAQSFSSGLSTVGRARGDAGEQDEQQGDQYSDGEGDADGHETTTEASDERKTRKNDDNDVKSNTKRTNNDRLMRMGQEKSSLSAQASPIMTANNNKLINYNNHLRNRTSASVSSSGTCVTQTTTTSTPVLVAGTKVKKTFTCQTLIMCSSVSTHCDHALGLMSKLNPLQSTWIKTDSLLVLEERPDKVCQALRLFLQGIGYSMSGYEKRLRLSRGVHSGNSLLGQVVVSSKSDVAGSSTGTPAHPASSVASSQTAAAAADSGTGTMASGGGKEKEEEEDKTKKTNKGHSSQTNSSGRHFGGHTRRRQSSVPS